MQPINPSISNKAFPSKVEHYENAFIFTSGTSKEGELDLVLKHRLDPVIKLYKKKLILRVMISGENSEESKREILAMRKYLIDEGMDSKDIFYDTESSDVYDSMYRAKNIYKIKRFVVISQKEYLYRALYIADSFDIDAVGYNCKESKYANSLYTSAHEFFFKLYDFFRCNF